VLNSTSVREVQGVRNKGEVFLERKNSSGYRKEVREKGGRTGEGRGASTEGGEDSQKRRTLAPKGVATMRNRKNSKMQCRREKTKNTNYQQRGLSPSSSPQKEIKK